jgi:hypothetical protein
MPGGARVATMPVIPSPPRDPMNPQRFMRWQPAGTLLLSLLAALLLADPAAAEGSDRPSTRRLQITVELQRQAALGPVRARPGGNAQPRCAAGRSLAGP